MSVGRSGLLSVTPSIILIFKLNMNSEFRHKKKQAKKRIEKLKEEINHHRYLYHVKDTQVISDAALDSLKQELEGLETLYPDLITPDSPTQRVGGEALDKFRKVEHSENMLSLFDAFSREDMRDWEARLKKLAPDLPLHYFCELKLDGLAIALRYQKQRFALAITRGDGRVGEDISSNIKTVESVPLRLRLPETKELRSLGFDRTAAGSIRKIALEDELEIRGELVMPYQAFKDLNKKFEQAGKPRLANPRNAVAGTVRQLDPKIVADRTLEFYGFELLGNLGLVSQEQKVGLLDLLGIKVLGENKSCFGLEEVFQFRDYWVNNKHKLSFGTDGVVVKVDRVKYWSVLGVVGKAPRYMIAYKFPAEQVTTKVKNVSWQVGRTGVLTPTALLEPVQVGGVTVSRASLHNQDEIDRLQIKIGDTVILERAGDVIPKIVSVLDNLRTGQEKTIKVPQTCPRCDSRVFRKKGEVAYRCSSSDCYAVNKESLVHWVSKPGVDIVGLGEKVVEQLMRAGLVNSISDFYRLKKGDLLSLERFSHKAATNLLQAIENSKVITLSRFIYALGIPYIGQETSFLLAKKVVTDLSLSQDRISILEIRKYFSRLSPADLEAIPDIGPVVAGSFCSWFSEEKNLLVLEELDKLGVVLSPDIKAGRDEKGDVEGKNFVLTGSLSGLTREDAKNKIKKLGGKVSSTVSKNTDYLVLGTDPGSKYDKAKDLGVVIIDEEQFKKILGI